MTRRSSRAARPAAGVLVTAALVLGLAACGGDDAGSDDPSADAGADAEPVDEAEAESEDDPGAAAAAVGSSEPSRLFADALHSIEPAEPGTARVTVAGETYVFEDLVVCGVEENERIGAFRASGGIAQPDDGEIYFELRRSVREVEAIGPGDDHERDFLQVAFQQAGGSIGMHETTLAAPGEPVTGDADSLPVILVVDDGGAISATAIAELVLPPMMDDTDAPVEGIAEFAVTC